MSSTIFVARPAGVPLPSDDVTTAIDLLRSHKYIVIPPKATSSYRTSIGRLQMDTEARIVAFDHESIVLTPLEARIMYVLIEHGSTWCSRPRMKQAIWDDALPRSNALSVHMTAVQRKLRAITDLAQPVVSLRDIGYRLSASLWT